MLMEEVRRAVSGRALCRWCGVEVTGRRRTFCSDACVHEWRLRSSSSYLRDCVFKRDRGVCALCSLDTTKLPRRGKRRRARSLWEADHIVAIREGGDSNLENLRTLCVLCHRQVTRALRERLRKASECEPKSARLAVADSSARE